MLCAHFNTILWYRVTTAPSVGQIVHYLLICDKFVIFSSWNDHYRPVCTSRRCNVSGTRQVAQRLNGLTIRVIQTFILTRSLPNNHQGRQDVVCLLMTSSVFISCRDKKSVGVVLYCYTVTCDDVWGTTNGFVVVRRLVTRLSMYVFINPRRWVNTRCNRCSNCCGDGLCNSSCFHNLCLDI